MVEVKMQRVSRISSGVDIDKRWNEDSITRSRTLWSRLVESSEDCSKIVGIEGSDSTGEKEWIAEQLKE